MRSRLERLLPGIVWAATFLVFLPALRNGFVLWDDDVNFLLNQNYRGFSAANLKWMWTTTLRGHYMPLTWMSSGLDYLLWGMEPLGYHLNNVLLHAFNAAVFYSLAVRLTAPAEAAGEALEERRARTVFAAVAALAFSVHPLRAESVAWATERRDVLSGLFFLLALRAHLKHRDGAGPRWYPASLLFFALSLLSKATCLMLAPLLVLLDVYPLRVLGGRAGWWTAEARRVWAEKVPFIALAFLAGLKLVGATLGLDARAKQFLAPEAFPDLAFRLLKSFYGACLPLWKTVFPFGLSPLYEVPASLPAAQKWLALCAGAFALLSLAFYLNRRRWPAGLAAWLFYLLALLPALGPTLPISLSNDRYSYLPCLPWALLAGAGLHRLWRRSRDAARVSAVLLIGFLSVLTWRQAGVWRNSETLWRHAIKIDPSAILAHNNLGVALLGQKRTDAAMEHFQRALEINPRFAAAHNNLGLAWEAKGRPDAAAGHYIKAIELDAAHLKAPRNLARVSEALGDHKLAAAAYEEALRRSPGPGPELHYGLGNALMRQNRPRDAAGQYEEALRSAPGSAVIHNNMGIALQALGDLENALAHYREAARLDPGSAQFGKNLEQLLAQLRRKS